MPLKTGKTLKKAWDEVWSIPGLLQDLPRPEALERMTLLLERRPRPGRLSATMEAEKGWEEGRTGSKMPVMGEALLPG